LDGREVSVGFVGEREADKLLVGVRRRGSGGSDPIFVDMRDYGVVLSQYGEK